MSTDQTSREIQALWDELKRLSTDAGDNYLELTRCIKEL